MKLITFTWSCFFGLAALLAGIFYFCNAASKFDRSEDVDVFCAPIISLSNEGTLRNDTWEAAPSLDPEGVGVFNYYGMGFPYFTGILFSPQDYEELFNVLSFYRALIPILAALLLWRLARRRGSTPTAPSWATFAALLATTFLPATEDLGRPENLASIILLTTILLLTFLPNRFYPLVCIVGLGLLGSVHPASGIMAGFFIAAVAVLRQSRRRATVETALIGTGAIALFFTLFVLYPVSISSWLYGFTNHADYAITQVPGGTLAWFLERASMAVFVILGGLIVLKSWWHLKGPHANGWPAMMLALGGLATISYFGLWKPRHYNISPLSSIVPIAAAITIDRWRGWHLSTISGISRFLLGGIAVGAICVIANLLLSHLAAPTYQEQRKIFTNLANPSKTFVIREIPYFLPDAPMLSRAEEFDQLAPGSIIITKADHWSSAVIARRSDFHKLVESPLPEPWKSLPQRIGKHYCGLRLASFEKASP